MDLSTIIGLLLGLGGLLTGFFMEKGTIGSLIQPSAFIIVFGGTMGAVLTSFPLKELKNVGKLFKVAFMNQSIDTYSTFQSLMNISQKARREGLLSLEQDVTKFDNEYLKNGLQLVIDGNDPDIIKQILDSNIISLEARHKVGISIFQSAGGYAPTLGIIGTVMGLVHVLGNLSNPSTLSSSIASAFIATLYGVSSANLLWLPIANKLKAKTKSEINLMEMMVEGLLSVQAGENPTILEEKLKGYLKGESLKNKNENLEGIKVGGLKLEEA